MLLAFAGLEPESPSPFLITHLCADLEPAHGKCQSAVCDVRHTFTTEKLSVKPFCAEEEPSQLSETLLVGLVVVNPGYNDVKALYVPTGSGVGSVAFTICMGGTSST